jgi:hypothetical protein
MVIFAAVCSLGNKELIEWLWEVESHPRHVPPRDNESIYHMEFLNCCKAGHLQLT